jgi:hypothetical protein
MSLWSDSRGRFVIVNRWLCVVATAQEPETGHGCNGARDDYPYHKE